MREAYFVTEVYVVDPDTKNSVDVSIFKHSNGGMFGIDTSYLNQCFDDHEEHIIPDPFGDQEDLELADGVFLMWDI